MYMYTFFQNKLLFNLYNLINFKKMKKSTVKIKK